MAPDSNEDTTAHKQGACKSTQKEHDKIGQLMLADHLSLLVSPSPSIWAVVDHTTMAQANMLLSRLISTHYTIFYKIVIRKV